MTDYQGRNYQIPQSAIEAAARAILDAEPECAAPTGLATWALRAAFDEMGMHWVICVGGGGYWRSVWVPMEES